MRKILYLVAAAGFAAGCSPAAKVETNNKPGGTNIAVVSQTVAPAANNQPNANVETSDDANKIVLRDTSVSRKNIRNWGDKNLGSKENTPIAENVTKAVTAASDNSEITNSMNGKGQPLETRVFKKHPQLAKIERVGLNNSEIKVYLKNGKALSFPQERAASFLTATAAEILEAVGIK